MKRSIKFYSISLLLIFLFFSIILFGLNGNVIEKISETHEIQHFSTFQSITGESLEEVDLQNPQEENEKKTQSEGEKMTKKEDLELKAEGNVEKTEAPFIPLAPVTIFTQDNYQKSIKNGTLVLIKYSTVLCEDCEAFDSVFNEFAWEHEKDNTMLVAQVDCTKQIEICFTENIQKYPTVKLFYKDMKFDYKGEILLDSLNAFVNKSVFLYSKSKQPLVLSLNPENFDQNIVHDKAVIVKFFSPRCPHCIHFAPTYEEFAKAVVDDPNIVVAEVDCTIHGGLCGSNKVQGYPTVKLFRDKKTRVFSGNRTVLDLVNFVHEMI